MGQLRSSSNCFRTASGISCKEQSNCFPPEPLYKRSGKQLHCWNQESVQKAFLVPVTWEPV